MPLVSKLFVIHLPFIIPFINQIILKSTTIHLGWGENLEIEPCTAERERNSKNELNSL